MASYSSANSPSLERDCYTCGVVGHFKRECPQRQIGLQGHQQANVVVPVSRGDGHNGNGNGCSQDRHYPNKGRLLAGVNTG